MTPMKDNGRATLQRITLIAVALTTGAEFGYFTVLGLYLFPGGSVLGKLVWTLTCSIGMGLVIGTLTYLWVDQRWLGRKAVFGAALVMAAVGSYCAWVCSRIDARFGYFGGDENAVLFILSGAVPAILGGLLFGWLVYGRGRSYGNEGV
jgi:hypothetical protein